MGEPRAMGEIQRVGVLGAGTMGAGIAQLCARAGIETLLCDANPDALATGLARIEKSLARAVERGKSTEAEAAEVRGRVTAGGVGRGARRASSWRSRSCRRSST